MPGERPPTPHREMLPHPPPARGDVTYTGIARGRAQWSFSGDVAPQWFRKSGARFVVTPEGLTLNGVTVAVGTVFTPGSL